MATKKRIKVSGVNKFQGVLVRPSREGQMREWREAAARSGQSFQDWAREQFDRGARK